MCVSKRPGLLSLACTDLGTQTLRPPSTLNFPSSFSLCLHCATTVFTSITLVSEIDEHTRALSLPSCWVFTVTAGAWKSGLWGPTDCIQVALRSHRGHVRRHTLSTTTYTSMCEWTNPIYRRQSHYVRSLLESSPPGRLRLGRSAMDLRFIYFQKEKRKTNLHG